VASPLVQTHDGVGIVCRGNLALVLYVADARLHRTRWLFDRVDELISRNTGGIFVLMVIDPSAGPPDAATRAENAARFKRMGSTLLSMVTVASGDDFRVSIVRTVMRAMVLLSGQSDRHVIVASEREGLDRLFSAAKGDSRLPGRPQVEADLSALHAELRQAGPGSSGA
jgi:hypothetical protein